VQAPPGLAEFLDALRDASQRNTDFLQGQLTQAQLEIVQLRAAAEKATSATAAKVREVAETSRTSVASLRSAWHQSAAQSEMQLRQARSHDFRCDNSLASGADSSPGALRVAAEGTLALVLSAAEAEKALSGAELFVPPARSRVGQQPHNGSAAGQQHFIITAGSKAAFVVLKRAAQKLRDLPAPSSGPKPGLARPYTDKQQELFPFILPHILRAAAAKHLYNINELTMKLKVTPPGQILLPGEKEKSYWYDAAGIQKEVFEEKEKKKREREQAAADADAPPS
jgi:hypothetical protein